MLYLRRFQPQALLDHLGLRWQQALPALADAHKPVWDLCTIVRDQDMALKDSKLFKSLKDCDDKKKKASLLQMVVALKHGLQYQDYQAAINKDLSGIIIKVGHNFTYQAKPEKVWELKYQKKDRMYFFTGPVPQASKLPFLALLQYEHKKDQETPQDVCESCANAMKPFLVPGAKIEII